MGSILARLSRSVVPLRFSIWRRQLSAQESHHMVSVALVSEQHHTISNHVVTELPRRGKPRWTSPRTSAHVYDTPTGFLASFLISRRSTSVV